MSLAGPASEPPSVAAARLLQIIEARFGDGLKAARAPTARRPGPDAEALRAAYLDVLKLCLCDLAGEGTTSVTRTTAGEVMSRELEGEQLRFRSAGMDWPLHGLTMVGLARLDDLQACVESVVRDGVEGDLIEAGTWRGGASILMRATLDSLGADERTVVVADSFQGFPPAPGDDGGYDLRSDLAGMDFLAVPLEEVRANFARFGLDRGLEFVPGFFEETLSALRGRRWSIVRLDGDTYEATRVSLEALYPGLAMGGYLIVDDYLQLEPCREAVDDFRREFGVTEPIEAVDWNGVRWQRQSEPAPIEPSRSQTQTQTGGSAPPLQPAAERTSHRVPTITEVELQHELEILRRRLADAETQIRRLESAPGRRLARRAARVRERLGR